MTESVFSNGFKEITIKTLTADDGDPTSVRFIIRDLITGNEIIAAFTQGEAIEIVENFEAVLDLESTYDPEYDIDYHQRKPGD